MLDKNPYWAWMGYDTSYKWALLICYKIWPENFDFKQSDENIEQRFVSRQDLELINLNPQIAKIKELL